jgi:hypothetical protein
MEFILEGIHGGTISVKDSGKDNYVLTVPTNAGAFYKIVIAKEQFKRLAKAS